MIQKLSGKDKTQRNHGIGEGTGECSREILPPAQEGCLETVPLRDKEGGLTKKRKGYYGQRQQEQGKHDSAIKIQERVS